MKILSKEFLLKYKSIIGLVVFSAFIAVLNPAFITPSNVLNILRQTSINAIIAAGVTFAILIGGIDLSVGSVLGISGAVAASMVAGGANAFQAVITAIAIGVGIGIFNGLVISKGKVQAFIATLGTMTLVRGYTLVYTQGMPISIGTGSQSNIFAQLGGGYFLGVPIPIYITAVVFVMGYYVLNYTRIGRYVYALGGNEEAAMLSGINVDKVKIFVFAVSGALAALAGIIVTSRLSSAQPQAGSGYELDAIAAVVLGGTSLVGGVGSIIGTVVGALIIGILNNALNLMNVSAYYQLVAKGLVILIAVLLDRKK